MQLRTLVFAMQQEFCQHIFLCMCSILRLHCSPPHLSKTPGAATQAKCWIRGLHVASVQGIKATLANLVRKECLVKQQVYKLFFIIFTNSVLESYNCNTLMYNVNQFVINFALAQKSFQHLIHNRQDLVQNTLDRI